MAKKKKKWYVVWAGHKPGIYTTWDEASAQVNGFSNAKYKSFESKAEAELAFNSAADQYVSKGKKGKPGPQPTQLGLRAGKSEVIWESVAVDAACSGNPGDLEYRGVDLATGKQLFIRGPYEQGTNNIGEFLGIVHALIVLKEKGLDLPIYSDSRTAISWVKKGKANTSLRRTPVNKPLFDLVDKAEAWLKENSYSTQVLKWDTGRWGEIPADFGRK